MSERVNYYRARFYNPGIGRFVSRDPLGLQGGINQYAYTNDNPVNLVDPMGLVATIVAQNGNYYGSNTLTDAGGGIYSSGDEKTKTCQCSALTFSAVGPNQANGIGALGISPPNDSLAINPAVFGLPYTTISERAASQQEIISNIPNIQINAPALSEFVTGSTTFSIGDVGDRNIRNSSTPRFDIYRFNTQQDALQFGIHTVPGTITGVPDSWSCPSTCTTAPSN